MAAHEAEGASTMSLTTIGTRSAITVDVETTVADIAAKMKTMSLGSVVVLREGLPVGIVTDRDLTVRVLATDNRPDELKAADVMSAPLASVGEHDEPLKAAMLMREAQVRRLPILDTDGRVAQSPASSGSAGRPRRPGSRA